MVQPSAAEWHYMQQAEQRQALQAFAGGSHSQVEAEDVSSSDEYAACVLLASWLATD